MSAGKIVLLVFGIIVLLVSFCLVAGGGALIWADITIKDSEGFYTTETVQLERDSYAIVTPSADIDLEAAWLWDWGNLATFKVEGSNNDPTKQIFMGVAEESDVQAYLSDVEYDEITQFRIHPYRVDYRNHPGTSEPTAPTSQTFWTASAHGAGIQTLEWELETGNHVLVLMNADGSAGVDLSTVVGAKVPLVLWIGVGLLIGGIFVLIIGVLMVYLAARRRGTVPPEPPETPASTENEGEKLKVEPVVTGEVENKTSMGLEANVAGLLCYLFGWVTGIIFFILEKENKLVRFHALQSIIVFGALSIASAIFGWIPFLGWIVSAFLGLVTFILWIVLMIKAYQGEKYKITWAGDFAEKQVS